MRSVLICAMLLVALSALPVVATEYTLDLADDGATYLVETGAEISLKFVHRLPGGSYRYEVERAGLLPVLEYETETVGEDGKKDRSAVSDDCHNLLTRLENAGKGDSESDLRAELLAAKARSGKDCLPRIKTYENGTQSSSEGELKVGEGETLRIVVTRSKPKPGREWIFEFNTGEDRRWLVHYGFSFLPDEDEEYFTSAAGEGEGDDDGGFIVSRAGDPSGAEFEPTVTFTYLPRIAGRNPYMPNFTAGIGADIDERLVFAGLSWVVGDNVSLFVGAAGHEQTRLKGIYREGQMVGEMLSGDQLVDDTFDLNVIVGVGFRFGKNPFKKEAAAKAASGGGESGGSESLKSPGGEGADSAGVGKAGDDNGGNGDDDGNGGDGDGDDGKGEDGNGKDDGEPDAGSDDDDGDSGDSEGDDTR